jgi:glycosyltransferase involved in cell wall biosynthesis
MSRRHDDITVIVTNFNYGRYLEEAVASALAQEGGAPRVIVVDDGSTDPETQVALERLPSSVLVHRQANQGVVAARNAGLALADTPLVLTLDADDRLPPGALAALKPPLDADPGLGFTYGIMRFFDQWHGEVPMPPYDPYRLLYRHTIAPTALMRSALVSDVGGFDADFAGYEDWEFWLAALRAGWRGKRVDAVTFDHRRHGASKLGRDRLEYHRWYRLLRAKHADLYARRREFARESDLGPVGRAVYRWWWGARPVPARVEHAAHSLLWARQARS